MRRPSDPVVQAAAIVAAIVAKDVLLPIARERAAPVAYQAIRDGWAWLNGETPIAMGIQWAFDAGHFYEKRTTATAPA